MVEPVRNSRDAEMFARRDLRDEPCDVPEILVLNDQGGWYHERFGQAGHHPGSDETP